MEYIPSRRTQIRNPPSPLPKQNLLHDPVSGKSEKPELVEVDHHEGEQGDAGEGQVQLARCYLNVCKACEGWGVQGFGYGLGLEGSGDSKYYFVGKVDACEA